MQMLNKLHYYNELEEGHIILQKSERVNEKVCIWERDRQRTFLYQEKKVKSENRIQKRFIVEREGDRDGK